MARDGYVLFFPVLIVTIIVWGFWIVTSQLSLLIIGSITGILTAFLGFFFRDPDRRIPQGEGILVSPADGFISAVKTLEMHPFLNSEAIQISIFLTIFDVHVNRIPVSGVVNNVEYKTGKFKAAYKDETSDLNEQTEISMTTNSGTRVVFKQIAGQLARRIVCRIKKGQNINAGDRFGMIKFGSRTDLIVPAGTQIEVKKGQHVNGGTTIIARLTTNKTKQASNLPPNSENKSA